MVCSCSLKIDSIRHLQTDALTGSSSHLTDINVLEKKSVFQSLLIKVVCILGPICKVIEKVIQLHFCYVICNL